MLVNSLSINAVAILSPARDTLAHGSSRIQTQEKHFTGSVSDFVSISERGKEKSINPLEDSSETKPQEYPLAQGRLPRPVPGIEEKESQSTEPVRSEEERQESDNQNSTLKISEQERKEISTLAARDTEVRAHERAHSSAGGKYAGAPGYSYTRGPDGKNYATGGEVSISISPVADNPTATLQKAEVVKRAALAPTQPSAQDRSVASRASQMALDARAEINLARLEQQQEPAEGSETDEDSVSGVEAESQESKKTSNESAATTDTQVGKSLAQQDSIKQLQKNPFIAEYTTSKISGGLIDAAV